MLLTSLSARTGIPQECSPYAWSLAGLVRPFALSKARGSVVASVLASLWGLALYAYPHGVSVEAEFQLFARLQFASRGLDLAGALDDAEASP